MALFSRRKRKGRGNSKPANNQQTKATNDKRTTAKYLQVGDVIKVGVPVRISSISTAKGTLHDALNRGQKVIDFKIAIDSGAFAGAKSSLSCTETDRVEILAITKPTLKRRLSIWWAKVKAYLFEEEDDKDGK